jgi:hypothetical protein
MSKTLEDRLTELDLALPATLVPRVLARAEQPLGRGARRPAWLTAALVAVVLLALLAGSLYAAPRFADALAGAPLVGGPAGALLRSIGLAPLDNRLTAINDVATSSGYRVTLIAGYADATQTVLVLRVEPAADLFGTTVLTDQFGRSLHETSGVFDSRNGNSVLGFSALPWPDSLLGARLGLRVVAVEPQVATPASAVRGDWNLHATLAVQPAQEVRPLPADGRLATTSFHFTSIVKSGPSLEVDMQVVGPLASHLTDAVGEISKVSKPHQAFTVRLMDASGSEVNGLSGDSGGGLGMQTVRNRWLVTAPGRYRLLVSFEGVGQFERPIDVP